MSFILYHTLGCHLCEEAEQVLQRVASAGYPVSYEKMDIAEQDALVEHFGIRIPVLSHQDSGACLDWPFDEPDVVAFLRRN